MRIPAKWLSEGMFRPDENGAARANETVGFLSSRHTNFAHERHIGIAEAREAGLVITALEEDQQLQELVVTREGYRDRPADRYRDSKFCFHDQLDVVTREVTRFRPQVKILLNRGCRRRLPVKQPSSISL